MQIIIIIIIIVIIFAFLKINEPDTPFAYSSTEDGHEEVDPQEVADGILDFKTNINNMILTLLHS